MKARHFALVAYSLFFLSFLFSQNAAASAIDLLGEMAQPLIAPAQQKLKNALVYIWVQPYGGYGQGKSEQKRTSPGGVTTTVGGLKVDGFVYGARGGLLILRNIRLGVDYSIQNAKRNTLVEGLNNTYSQRAVSGANTMFGATIGFDIPHTPLQGFYTQYFKATMKGDGASAGDGWGAGVSFVLKNPFILSLETRNLNYSSGLGPGASRAESSFTQYYANLIFSLF